MAIIRHPGYKEDYDEYCKAINNHDKVAIEQSEKKIATKWGEYPPPTIFPPYRTVEQQQGYGYEDPIEVIESFPIEDDPARIKVSDDRFLTQIIENRELVYRAIERPSEEDRKKQMDVFKKELQEHTVVKGRYLYLRIDLTQTTEALNHAFLKQIKPYKDYFPEENGRNKDGSYSPWRIHQMYDYYGLNFIEIARRLTGMTDIPSIDVNLRAYCKQVERAHKKACMMIDEVGKKAGYKPIFK